MAYVAANAGEQLLIKIGDGGGPETFTTSVLINLDRSVELSAEAVATQIPDSSNPSAPAKVVRAVTAIDWRIQGQGVSDKATEKTLADKLIAGTPFNVKAYNNATGALVLTGSVVLTQLSLSGSRGGKVMFACTMEGADLPTSSAAS